MSLVTRRPIPKSRVSPTTVSVRNARCSLKYCLIREALVADELRVDALGDDLGPKRPRGLFADAAVEDQRDLGGPADVEVVADHALKERPARGGTVRHSGVGDLELAHRQLVGVPGPKVSPGERGWQPPLPAPEELLDRPPPEPVADALQRGRVIASGKAVV